MVVAVGFGAYSEDYRESPPARHPTVEGFLVHLQQRAQFLVERRFGHHRPAIAEGKCETIQHPLSAIHLDGAQMSPVSLRLFAWRCLEPFAPPRCMLIPAAVAASLSKSCSPLMPLSAQGHLEVLDEGIHYRQPSKRNIAELDIHVQCLVSAH